MAPYYIIYSIIILNGLINFKNEDNGMETNKQTNIYKIKKHITSYQFTFFLLFLFAALRGNGNGDYFNYISGVKYVNTISFLFKPIDYPFEFGFRFLSYISNLFGLNPQFVIAGMNAISFCMVYKFVSKRSVNKFLSLFVFFPIVLLFDMHHSRSAVAISSGLLVFDSIMDNKNLKALLYLLLGFLFHKSSIILFILFLIKPLQEFEARRGVKNLILQSYIFLLFLIVFVVFTNPLISAIELFNNYFTINIYNKLFSYLTNERWSYKFSLLDPRLILNLGIYLFFSRFYNDKNKYGNALIFIQFISLSSMILLSHSTILVMRVYNFFNIFMVVSVPYFIELYVSQQRNQSYNINHFLKYKNKQGIIILSFLLIYFLYTIILTTKQVPYKFFFLNLNLG